MKKLIIISCLMIILGMTDVPKPCEEHQKLDYCWLEQLHTHGFGNGEK